MSQFRHSITHRFMTSRFYRFALAPLALGFTLLSVLCSQVSAFATELPPGVLNYLRQKDPKIRVRFDGLVLFNNGETYVPVIPQDPALNADSQQVIATIPDKTAYPDLIQFDNNFFLMRLILTSSGRLTFPKMAEYPLQLKEGLLPQDFVMPSNLFIPVELKVILGALPYNPSYSPDANTALVPPAVALTQGENGQEVKFSVKNRLTYVFDLNEQKIWLIESLTGKKISDVMVDGVPAALKLSSDGKLLFIPSLSGNDLVVVDTGANLVKTRVPLGQRPDSIVYVPNTQEVVISNRFSDYVSVVNANELLGQVKIPLPASGYGGAMALWLKDEKQPKILVADSSRPKIYVVDLLTRTVEATWDALPNISAIKPLKNKQGEWEIWLASRTQDQIVPLTMQGKMGTPIKVGKKPVEMVAYNNQLFILSAGDAVVDRVDLGNRTLLPSIALAEDSFPSGMVFVPSEQRAYITAAGSTDFIILNLALAQVENTVPVNFRASMITMTPDETLAEVEKITVDQVFSEQSASSANGNASPGKKAEKAHLQKPPATTNGPTPSGRVSGRFSILKFGKEVPSAKQQTPTQSSSPDSSASSVAKPGARLAQPVQDNDTADLTTSSPKGASTAKQSSTQPIPSGLTPLGD